MARTNSDVLAALRAKLGDEKPVSLQAIDQRRKKIRALVDMPTDIATYVIAQREGVRTSKWLDEDTLRRVADFEARLAAKEGGSTAPVTRAKGGKSSASAPKNVTVGGKVKVLRER